jgi:hypothetical protein
MKELIREMQATYFTDVATLMFIIIMLVIYFSKNIHYPPLKYLPLYLIGFIFLYVYDYIGCFFYDLSHTKTWTKIDKISELFVTLLEFGTFSYYFLTIMGQKRIKRIFTSFILFALLLFVGSSVMVIYSYGFYRYKDLHSVLIGESTVLLTFSILHLREVFIKKKQKSVRDLPEFWVTSGLLLYIAGTFPITIITDYFYSTNLSLYKKLYSVIYILYILFFLMIIRSFGCRQIKTIS